MKKTKYIILSLVISFIYITNLAFADALPSLQEFQSGINQNGIINSYLNGGTKLPTNGGQDRNPIGISGVSELGIGDSYVNSVQSINTNIGKVKTLDQGLQYVAGEANKSKMTVTDKTGLTDGQIQQNIENSSFFQQNIKGKAWESVFKNATTTIVGFIGLLVFGLLLYGGFLYLTSAGSADMRTKFQNIIFSVIGGAILILFAYTIISWMSSAINSNFTG